jgi:hypothetical protein
MSKNLINLELVESKKADRLLEQRFINIKPNYCYLLLVKELCTLYKYIPVNSLNKFSSFLILSSFCFKAEYLKGEIF